MKQKTISCLCAVSLCFALSGCSAVGDLLFNEFDFSGFVSSNQNGSPSSQPDNPSNTPSTLPTPSSSGNQAVSVRDYSTEFSTTYSGQTMNFKISGNTIEIWGNDENPKHRCYMIVFNNDSENAGKVMIDNQKFNSAVSIPSALSDATMDIYVGEAEYGYFESVILDFIKIENRNGNWAFVTSPVYEENVRIYNLPKSTDENLKSTERIQSDNPEISELARTITDGCTSEYEQVRAIHDWVAENIYYDYDGLLSGNYGDVDAVNVLHNKKGVCEGYANLVAALIRSRNIPCMVQGGYALGVGTDKEWSPANLNVTVGNHAWNEAYVDGRWIIMDVTWDSQNKYEGGKFEKGSFVNSIYFDSTLEFFSLSHKKIKEK